MKEQIKKISPKWVLELFRKVRVSRLRRSNALLSNKEVFTKIYNRNEWGGKPGEYCSGSGSSDKYTKRYSDVVKDFMAENSVRTVLDLGCGDFNIGRHLVTQDIDYIGADIVEGLIERNQKEFGQENITFLCLDIVNDDLPDADLCLIRQVLQHCSNEQIIAILEKINKYRYIIITEHYPSDLIEAVPNKDKIHGGDTRLVDNSAVYLDHPPFDVMISQVLIDMPVDDYIVRPGEKIKSFLINNRL